MRVRMVTGISGGRHDGREWPAAGYEIDVPDHEGEDLVRAKHAIYVGPAGDPGGTAVPPVTSESAPTAAGPVITEDEPSGVPDTEPAAGQTAPEPSPGDPKQAWIDYAISQGARGDQVNTMTKADLMSRYGGRL